MSSIILRYKYVPKDKSFEAPFDKGGSLSIIKDGTMKFTHPKDFNDPFDCYPEVDTKAISKDYGQSDKEFFKKLGNICGLSPAQRIQERPKQLKKLENDSSFNERLNNEIGICSLSKNPLNLLMWSHYASSHTGFVVEFSIPEKSSFPVGAGCLSNWLFPLPVIYEKEKPIIKTANQEREPLKEFFLTKGKDWKYEQEERVLDFKRKSGIHS